MGGCVSERAKAKKDTIDINQKPELVRNSSTKDNELTAVSCQQYRQDNQMFDQYDQIPPLPQGSTLKTQPQS